MKRSILLACLITVAILMKGCINEHPANETATPGWKNIVQQKWSLLGHRNWILIVDKAFPEQTAEGVETINTGESLVDVLQYVSKSLDSVSHIRPIIYSDKELEYVDERLSPGIDTLKSGLNMVLKERKINTILHEEVFRKIEAAAGLFSVLVLKTEELHPYTSVFIELDCAYWSTEKEGALRAKMK